MTLDRIAFAWGCSSYHGWGIIGLNLMLHWQGEALSLMSDLDAELGPSDPRQEQLRQRIMRSVRLQRDLLECHNGLHPLAVVSLEEQVWLALGNDFAAPQMPWRFPDERCVAFPVFEDLTVAAGHIDRLSPYPLVIAASLWNREFLRAHGIDAKLCHQGYDPVLFHPGVRRKRDDGRFRVFSGGKCEWRKGQDLVLQAFARFAETHDDAVLVAAWGSPWPGLAHSFASHGIDPPPGSEHGMPNYRAWAHAHGIKPNQLEIVPRLPNWRMPEIYGSVDVALFPNRAEGGTNLVAMEVMACGVPAIIADRAGQSDLPEDCSFPIDCLDFDYTDITVHSMVEQLNSIYCGGIAWSPLGLEWSWPVRLAELRSILSEA